MSSSWQGYLQRARWFAGKDEGRLSGIEPLDWYTPPGALPAVRSELARVVRAGGAETYHLLVGYLPPGTADPDALVDRTELAPFGPVDMVDAAASIPTMEALFDALGSPDPSSSSQPSSPRWRRSPPGDHLGREVPAPSGTTKRVRLLRADQSNSAVIAGDSLVKVYRRLNEGPNPEPEMLAALTGAPVPALHGVLSQHGYDLLAAIEFLADAQDGWGFATAACAADRPVDRELESLGRALREVHEGLSEAFGVQTASGGRLRGHLLDDLEEAVDRLPALGPHRSRLAAVLAGLPEGEIVTQRVHGDFHLGQTLLTPTGWRIIDFEGEPGTPMAKRREFDTPWRDVAGLLRSLDYARSAAPDPEGSRAQRWYQRSRTAFLAGYGTEPESFPLLAAHEVARMVYEVGYEARNRPDWVRIPLSAVENVATRH